MPRTESHLVGDLSERRRDLQPVNGVNGLDTPAISRKTSEPPPNPRVIRYNRSQRERRAPTRPAPAPSEDRGFVMGGQMPVQRGKDSDGPYYRWGNTGKKYRYTAGNKASREQAKTNAEKQGQAIKASGGD